MSSDAEPPAKRHKKHVFVDPRQKMSPQLIRFRICEPLCGFKFRVWLRQYDSCRYLVRQENKNCFVSEISEHKIVTAGTPNLHNSEVEDATYVLVQWEIAEAQSTDVPVSTAELFKV